MNMAVTDMIERGLSPAYQRLLADKKKWSTYIHLKWFSLEPVTERQVRYHRVLGMGAFGTVNGCIVAQIGWFFGSEIKSGAVRTRRISAH